jgi:glycosyltransferase involved in cell wall biosynthesis
MRKLTVQTGAKISHIGIAQQSSAEWAAAATYTRMLTLSLSQVCGDIKLSRLSSTPETENAHTEPNVALISTRPFTDLPGERIVRRVFGLAPKRAQLRGESRLRKTLRLQDSSDIFVTAREHGIDVILPVFDMPPWQTGVKAIGWVPDLQHANLPNLFSDQERVRRNASILRLASRASLIMVSSESSAADFVRLFPTAKQKLRVVRFPSLLAFLPLDQPSNAVPTSLNLPEKFALIANQFWAHKNHQLVIEALGKLKRRGLSIPVVMTGMPTDYRDPSGKTLSNLLQAIAANDLSSEVIILGMVPYQHLIELMRSAALIIQPSRSEGWSTVVEDAKCIGRPVLCSDLAVHKEQVPDALGFFPCDDAEQLAALMGTHWASLEAGPDPERERLSIATEQAFALDHGRRLLSICVEANEM